MACLNVLSRNNWRINRLILLFNLCPFRVEAAINMAYLLLRTSFLNIKIDKFLAIFYLYFLSFYWYPATLFQWGSYGTFDDDVPLWFKSLRILLLIIMILQLVRAGAVKKWLLAPLIFVIYGAISNPSMNSILSLVTFFLSIIIATSIKVGEINWDKHIRRISYVIYVTSIAELLGLVVSAHTYGEELRIVSTFGGPNNAGIIISGIAIYFFNNYRQTKQKIYFFHFVLCSILVMLTGSLSAVLAYSICITVLNPRFLLALPVFAGAALMANDFVALKIQYFIAILSGAGDTTAGSFTDRLENFSKIYNYFSSNILYMFFGSGVNSESDYFNLIGQYGLVGALLALLVFALFRPNIFITLGLIQGVVTPFIFSFPSFSIIYLLSRIYGNRNSEIKTPIDKT